MRKLHFYITWLLFLPFALIAQIEPSDSLKNLIPGDSAEIVYQVVDKSASFPGGLDALFKWLSGNVSYPQEARDSMVEGVVFVQFVVEKDGRINNVEVFKGVNPVLDLAAVEAVNKMPDWIPGEQLGQPVRSLFVLPISFQLDSSKSKPSGRKKNRTQKK